MIVAVVGRQCGKTIVGEYVETEDEPEDISKNEVADVPCSRIIPTGHLLPWYTSGFQ